MAISSLSDELRASTRAAHDRLERLPFALSLAAGSLPIESYVGYLRAMAVLHAVMEHELPVEAEERIDAIWRDGMRRLPALHRDLAHFAPQDLGHIPAAQRAADEVANRLLLRSAEAPLSMLGYLYVLEGSILGAAVLKSQAERAFALDPVHGLCYLGQDARAGRQRWQGFRQRLDGLALSAEEGAAVEAAAIEAFAGIESVLRALYPFDREALVRAPTALNP